MEEINRKWKAIWENVKGYWNNEYIFNCYLYKRVKNQNI